MKAEIILWDLNLQFKWNQNCFGGPAGLWADQEQPCAATQAFPKGPNLHHETPADQPRHVVPSAGTFSWLGNACVRTEMVSKERKSPTVFVCSRKWIVVEDGSSGTHAWVHPSVPPLRVVHLSVYIHKNIYTKYNTKMYTISVFFKTLPNDELRRFAVSSMFLSA